MRSSGANLNVALQIKIRVTSKNLKVSALGAVCNFTFLLLPFSLSGI
jgi:hypothetical protein